jgi:hypothetical protein
MPPTDSIRRSNVTSRRRRLEFVSRARVTQIMNLLNLSPAILAAILDLGPVDTGRDPVTERELRPVTDIHDWQSQCRRFAEI